MRMVQKYHQELIFDNRVKSKWDSGEKRHAPEAGSVAEPDSIKTTVVESKSP
jgi:hypothetical protein